ncbi:hypothetical protein LP420_20645 [Massilia sp. B-10]|nr:hypothetical protein LP420_20645 [Massilia sp. B-10]
MGKFDFTLAGNFTKTEVTRVPATEELAALNPAPPLFGRLNVLSFEKASRRTSSMPVPAGSSALWARPCVQRAMAKCCRRTPQRARLYALGQDRGRRRAALRPDQQGQPGLWR